MRQEFWRLRAGCQLFENSVALASLIRCAEQAVAPGTDPSLTQGTCAVYLCGSAESQATCSSVADDLQSILNTCTTGSTVRGADVSDCSPGFPAFRLPPAILKSPALLQIRIIPSASGVCL